MNVYELLGRKEAELQILKEQNRLLTDMIKDLKSGDRTLDDIEIKSPVKAEVPVEASANGTEPGA